MLVPIGFVASVHSSTLRSFWLTRKNEQGLCGSFKILEGLAASLSLRYSARRAMVER